MYYPTTSTLRPLPHFLHDSPRIYSRTGNLAASGGLDDHLSDKFALSLRALCVCVFVFSAERALSCQCLIKPKEEKRFINIRIRDGTKARSEHKKRLKRPQVPETIGNCKPCFRMYTLYLHMHSLPNVSGPSGDCCTQTIKPAAWRR